MLVIWEIIWYHGFMTTETTISSTEKHNATVSYCFLAVFMLLSREERFSNHFVRSHSRYAALIHIGFLLLIAALIYSRNFSSIIIFEISWVHILIFIWFFVLLGVLGIGMYRAMLWKEPHFSLKGINLSELKWLNNEVTLSEDQKVPLLLAHIPFVWIYLSQKYGNFLSGGTKFGNWAFIISAWCLWIDPSLTLFITWLCATTFWIVYQGVMLSSNDSINIVWDKLYSAVDVHIFIKKIFTYIINMFKPGKELPNWESIQKEETEKYNKNITLHASTKLMIPLISMVEIWFAARNKDIHQAEIQAILINILSIYGVYTWNMPLMMLLVLAVFWSYFQAKNQKDTSIPCIGEISDILQKIIEWKKNKSIAQKITFTSNNS